MSQRKSGYERKENDAYYTPSWCTEALIPYLPHPPLTIWEPAAGNNKIASVLQAAGYDVITTDLSQGTNFLEEKSYSGRGIVTNPPYKLGQKFIEHALDIIPKGGFIAMLLRTDFDHAKTRRHLFGDCAWFEKKVVLTKRIRWFEDSTGSPSFNHAWFLWSYPDPLFGFINRPKLSYYYENAHGN